MARSRECTDGCARAPWQVPPAADIENETLLQMQGLDCPVESPLYPSRGRSGGIFNSTIRVGEEYIG